MLQIRLYCENCGKNLPNDSDQAMICSYECTFCSNCVSQILKNICPNCGGGFEKRPTRPKKFLKKDPAQKEKIVKPVFENSFFKKNVHRDPRKR